MARPSYDLLILVQARYGSSRLPGKILAPICGQPLIAWLCWRLQQLPEYLTYQLCVALPDSDQDHDVARTLERHGISTFRPSDDGKHIPENDVLGRLLACVKFLRAYHGEPYRIARITGDCPFIDAHIVFRLFQYMEKRSWDDYVGLDYTWPDGVDCELFTPEALERTAAEATLPSDLEHVTPYMWRSGSPFRSSRLPCPFDMSTEKWSIDTPDDLTLVNNCFTDCLALYGPGFTWLQVYSVLQTRPWAAYYRENRALHKRNEGFCQQVAREWGLDPSKVTWRSLIGE